MRSARPTKRLFGGPPSTARLAELLALPGAAPNSRADTVASGEPTAPSPVGSTPEVALRVGGSGRPSGDTAAMADTRLSDDDLGRDARPAVLNASVGLSTAEPVSSTARRNATTARPHARSHAWLAAVALLALGAVGVAAVRLPSGGDEGTRAAPSSLGAASLVAATASTDVAAPAPAPSNPPGRAASAASMSSPPSTAKGEPFGVRRPPIALKAPPSATPCKLVVKQTGIDPDGQPHFAKVCE